MHHESEIPRSISGSEEARRLRRQHEDRRRHEHHASAHRVSVRLRDGHRAHLLERISGAQPVLGRPRNNRANCFPISSPPRPRANAAGRRPRRMRDQPHLG